MWTFLFWNIFFPLALAYAISQLTKTNEPKLAPQEFEDMDVAEGRNFAIIFGTVSIDDALCAWYGNRATQEQTETVRGGFLGLEKKRITTGYQYYAGFHYLITEGVTDGIKQIHIGDDLAWPDLTDITVFASDGETSITIDAPNLYGGKNNGGGFVSDVDIEYGYAGQDVNDYLASILGSDISANRGFTGVVFRRAYIGESPYPRAPRFLIKRTDLLTSGQAQWYSSKADISGSLNAAHIIRECLTDDEWGEGHSISLFDDTIWQAVADTLYDEGAGLSMRYFAEGQSVEDFVNDVLRHINAVLYRELTTGEYILKLIRDDYDPDTLDQFDIDTGIVSLEDFTRPTMGTIPDVINLEYWDPVNHKTKFLRDYNPALVQIQGGRIAPYEVRYEGIILDAYAAKVSSRERRQLETLSPMMTLKGNRAFYQKRPGDVFKISYPPLDITDMIVRVLDIDYGTLTDGTITMKCVEDVFSVEAASFGGHPGTSFPDIDNVAADVDDYLLMEALYFDIAGTIGTAAAGNLDDDIGYLFAMAGAPTGDATDYELLLRNSPSDDFINSGIYGFTPTTTILTDIPLNADDVVVGVYDANALLSVEENTLALIGNELFKVKAVSVGDGEVTLARGVLDTVPEAHSGVDSSVAGDRIWFLGAGFISANEYMAADMPGVKFLTRTKLGTLAEGSATAHNASAFDSRLTRPYPPGDFQINSMSYPSTFSGQPTISWNHRDRTQQLNSITEHTDASIGQEVGVTYEIDIYDENDLLLRNVTGLTGTSYTYDYADELSDSGLNSGDPLNSSLRFVLRSRRSGYASWQEYDLRVTRV